MLLKIIAVSKKITNFANHLCGDAPEASPQKYALTSRPPCCRCVWIVCPISREHGPGIMSDKHLVTTKSKKSNEHFKLQDTFRNP